MSSALVTTPVRAVGNTSLAHRLRRDTAALHAEVEEVSDLPGSVATRADYRELLLVFESVWVDLAAVPVGPVWSAHWQVLGVQPAGAEQLDLIRADLGRPGSASTGRSVRSGRSWVRQVGVGRSAALQARADEQLGRLYVLEGSALGRRVLAPALVAKLGDIGVSFFLDDERHPRGWRAVQSALSTLDDEPDRQDAVVRGANTAFEVFLSHLRRRSATAGLPVG